MVRDRTLEFTSTIKSMAGRPQFVANGSIPELRVRKGANGSTSLSSSSVTTPLLGATKPASPFSNPSSSQYTQFSRFMGGSRSIAHDLALTYQKLEKINLLAQKKTIFDDEESSKELNELVYIVKQDITSLNKQIEALRQQQLQQLQQSQTGQNNVRSHSKNVVLTLQQQLASISSSFKSTLELRTRNMKKQKQRREQFTNAPMSLNAAPSIFSSSAQQGQSSLTHSRSASTLSTVIDLGDGAPDGGQATTTTSRHRHNNSATFQTQTLLQFEDQSNQYLEDRANTMQSIESTIVELGTIFNQLATMVQQQEEMITRIDSNVTDTLMNVESAHQSLLQYLASVTSNRWLIIKVFAVLFVFFLIFVLFAS